MQLLKQTRKSGQKRLKSWNRKKSEERFGTHFGGECVNFVKEKEAYQRQKEQLEREEAAAKLAAEEKANLRKQREEREQKEREEREQKEREEREREGQKQKQEQKEEETNLQEETKEQQAPEGNVTLQEEQQKASSSQDTQNRIAASVEASKPKTFRCRALLNYDAKNENELTFKKDDVIFVISPDLSAKVHL